MEKSMSQNVHLRHCVTWKSNFFASKRLQAQRQVTTQDSKKKLIIIVRQSIAQRIVIATKRDRAYEWKRASNPWMETEYVYNMYIHYLRFRVNSCRIWEARYHNPSPGVVQRASSIMCGQIKTPISTKVFQMRTNEAKRNFLEFSFFHSWISNGVKMWKTKAIKIIKEI